MNREDIKNIVQSILVEHFSVTVTAEMWNTTLENLNKGFKFLDFLRKLEQLLQSRFNKKILLIENISAAIHTPEDIITLIFGIIPDET